MPTLASTTPLAVPLGALFLFNPAHGLVVAEPDTIKECTKADSSHQYLFEAYESIAKDGIVSSRTAGELLVAALEPMRSRLLSARLPRLSAAQLTEGSLCPQLTLKEAVVPTVAPTTMP